MFQALRVHAAYRGRQIASTLAKELAVYVAQHHGNALQHRITTLAGNEASIRLHAKQVRFCILGSASCLPHGAYTTLLMAQGYVERAKYLYVRVKQPETHAVSLSWCVCGCLRVKI